MNIRSSSFSVIRQVLPSRPESSRTAGLDGKACGSSLLAFEVSTVELAIGLIVHDLYVVAVIYPIPGDWQLRTGFAIS